MGGEACGVGRMGAAGKQTLAHSGQIRPDQIRSPSQPLHDLDFGVDMLLIYMTARSFIMFVGRDLLWHGSCAHLSPWDLYGTTLAQHLTKANI